MNLRHLVLAGLAALALSGTALAQSTTPTPAPAPRTTASPAATGTPEPRRGRRGNNPSPEPSASDTPMPPQFSTMDGVWEVVLQPISGPNAGKPAYSHLFIVQKGDALTGRWVRDDQNKKSYDFTGTFDGRLYTLTLKDGAANAFTMTGYAENFGDMVGLLKATANTADLGTPFTASHRKKEKAE